MVHFFELMCMAASSVFAKNVSGRGKLCVADHEHCGNLQQLHQALIVPGHHISKPRRKAL